MSHIYCKYCEAKIAFLEALIDNLLELHDLGGTIPIFHSFDEKLTSCRTSSTICYYSRC